MSTLKRILVTGVNGFVGHHLAQKLHEQGHTVIGVGQDPSPTEKNKPFLQNYIECDLTSAESVKSLDLGQIDGVINLAGLANVGMSFDKPAEFIAANTTMVINLLQHAMANKSQARFIIISSGAVYEGEQPMPITEDGGVITHNSPYAISKLATEYLGDYYRSRGVHCLVARPFNHIGPGQGPGFLLPDLASQIQKFKNGEVDEIVVGDLTTKRDYTDVRDVVQAYITLVTGDDEPQQALYNVCSGTSRSGEEILQRLIEAFNFDAQPKVRVDEKRLRPNDPKDIRGSSDRLRQEFNWQPTISLDETIRDFVAGLS